MNNPQALYENYLVCDADNPLITSSSLSDEILLYNLSPAAQELLLFQFVRITAKELSLESKVDELSGGQKVVLMCLLALLSSAKSIVFLNLNKSLDSIRRDFLREIWKDLGTGKEIVHWSDSDSR